MRTRAQRHSEYIEIRMNNEVLLDEKDNLSHLIRRRRIYFEEFKSAVGNWIRRKPFGRLTSEDFGVRWASESVHGGGAKSVSCC